MIVLHKEKIILLRAHKVASTSLEIAFSKFAKKDSIITTIKSSDEKIRKEKGFAGPQNYRYSIKDLLSLSKLNILKTLYYRKLPVKFHNHISAQRAKELLGEKIWNSYTKISVIRNPYDRLVSSYFWNKAINIKNEFPSFEQFILNHPNRIIDNDLLYKIDGNNIIDFMIRYENFADDLQVLEHKFPALQGLKDTFLQISAKGHTRPKSSTAQKIFATAPRAFNIITNLCHDDIVSYNFEIPKVEFKTEVIS